MFSFLHDEEKNYISKKKDFNETNIKESKNTYFRRQNI